MSKDREQQLRPPHREAAAASDRVVETGKTRSSPTSSVPKVRIRIKLLEEDRMRKERDQVDAEQHVCSLCGKGFRSGKALGGHMRVHSQRERSDKLDINGVDRAAGNSSEMEYERGGNEEEKMKRSCDELRMTVGGGKPICPICRRDFPSNKALFGHMRCHPDRNWRGIQPPVYSSSSTVSDVQARSSDKSDDDVNDYCDDDGHHLMELDETVIVDLEKDLLNIGWGKKARRGREAPVKSCASLRTGFPVGLGNTVDSIPPDQAAGAQNLLLLSRGEVVERSGKSEIGTEKRSPPAGIVIRDPVNFMKKLKFYGAEVLAVESRGKKRKSSQMLTAEEISGFAYSTNKKFKFANDKIGEAAGIEDWTESDRRIVSGNCDVCESKKMQKVRKYLMVNELKAMSGNPHHSSPVKLLGHHQVNMEVPEMERYRCTNCNKSFSSHQALGGHMSSHNKLRNAQGFRNENVITADEGPINLGLTMAATCVHPLHQCNVCYKIYPTGQALGGHKRLHCSSVISKALPPIVVAAPVAQASENAREVCKFDLNELPPLEVDAIIHPVQPQETLEDAGEEDLHVPRSLSSSLA